MKLRAAVPAGSVFLAEGVVDEPANALTEPLVAGAPRRRSGAARAVGRAGAGRARRRGPVRDAAVGAAAAPAAGGGHVIPVAEVGFYEDWWIQLLKALVIFAVVFQLVPIVLLAERKVLGRFQHRYGPNRVGPFGILQPMADIGKLIFKQQFRPRTSVGWLFTIAPAISMFTAVATIAIIPFSNTVDIFGTEVGLYGIDPDSRDPVRVRVRRDRVLRPDARRLGVRLEVLVPGRDARRRAADLLRGRAGPRRSSA